MNDTNIVHNHDFSRALTNWRANCCAASLRASNDDPSSFFAVVSGRTEAWQGLEQSLTGRVSRGVAYSVAAHVRASGPIGDRGRASRIQATLRLARQGSDHEFVLISKVCGPEGRWALLEGTFSLESLRPKTEIVFYLEGPSPGVDLHIKSVVIKEIQQRIANPNFEDGLEHWSGKDSEIDVQGSLPGRDGKRILPRSGRFFVCTRNRTQSYQGIEQDITGRVCRKLAYEVDAYVRILDHHDTSVTSSDVCATVCLEMENRRSEYIQVAKVQATDNDWRRLHGKFIINGDPSSVVVYVEGPSRGIDILLDSFLINRATANNVRHLLRSDTECETSFGVNIIKNSNLTSGNTDNWSGNGCSLHVKSTSPLPLPPLAKDSLEPHNNGQSNNTAVTRRFLLSTKRTEDWMGPGQNITDTIKLFVTYQVSGWVRVGHGKQGRQKVAVKLEVTRAMKSEPDRWVDVCEVETDSDRWYEIAGSFRVEKQRSNVKIFVFGPEPGIDLHLAGFLVFPVDRRSRFAHLKKQTDKIRKRDVILKFSGANSGRISSVKVRQSEISFPFGSCLQRSNLHNEDFKKFFLENFNWAVFSNELKWHHTECEQGRSVNYDDAEEMSQFCRENNVQVRGHCLFWEVEGNDPKRLCSLTKNDLWQAIEERLQGLLKRFVGKFAHHDVVNETLHGSFYRGRLGDEFITKMFKRVKELDPAAILFTNEYHVEDARDVRSSPEKYVKHIEYLIRQGAPVGGIGIQGHNECPVGPVIHSSLNKLSILGLPIWFTELEVFSADEQVRAEDLEVMIREAFAHPAVEGIMLWGFWELYMTKNSKNVSCLVGAEGEINEAGERYQMLRDEFRTKCDGDRVDGDGQFKFRGFHGTYTVEITTGSDTFSRSFALEKGDSPLLVPIHL